MLFLLSVPAHLGVHTRSLIGFVVAKQVPLERLLIETDCPFLAPIPHRGKRNEPAFVVETARKLGELRGLSAEEIGTQTAANFYRFFSLHEKANSI